jgi:hypothetical protein
VAGINDGIRGKSEQFPSDALNQESTIPIGKVIAADAAAEQDIAPEYEDRRPAPNKDDVTGGMARNVEHFKRESGRLYKVAFLHHTVGGWARDRHPEYRTEVSHRIGQHACLGGSDEKWGIGKCLFKSGIAGDVIGMSVGVEDGRQGKTLITKAIKNEVRFQTGIEDDTIGPSGEPNHVGVFLKRLRNNCANV